LERTGCAGRSTGALDGKMANQVDVGAIETLFESIQGAFPHLTMRLDRHHPHVELNMDIPRQPGLLFDVNLNLQGDELHLSAGSFWLEWFPCTKPDVVAAFEEAVNGVLSGTFRIVEHLRGPRAVKAQLQKPATNGWQTVGTRSTIYLPFGRKSMRVLKNVHDEAV
jgi:hypothetical protein